jgi:hypothetical protein
VNEEAPDVTPFQEAYEVVPLKITEPFGQVGVTDEDGDDDVDVPAAFVAVTVNV